MPSAHIREVKLQEAKLADMLKLNASDKEREEFRVRSLETRVKELEAIVAGLLHGRIPDDEIDGWLAGVKMLETDFTPLLAVVRGRGERMANKLKAQTADSPASHAPK